MKGFKSDVATCPLAAGERSTVAAAGQLGGERGDSSDDGSAYPPRGATMRGCAAHAVKAACRIAFRPRAASEMFAPAHAAVSVPIAAAPVAGLHARRTPRSFRSAPVRQALPSAAVSLGSQAPVLQVGMKAALRSRAGRRLGARRACRGAGASI